MTLRTPISTGNFCHIYNRGTRKLDINHDELDFEYFLQTLFFLNDSHSIIGIFQILREKFPNELSKLEWPHIWEERDPLVRVHAFIIMRNHFHLILEEIREGGISLFMQKLGTGITNRYNTRYGTSGSLFQGKYKYIVVDEENYLQNLGLYVQVNNAFELYPGGYGRAISEFDEAFDFACDYRFGSLSHYAGTHKTPIVGQAGESMFNEIDNINSYKKFARKELFSGSFGDDMEEVKID